MTFMAKKRLPCQWITLHEALTTFVLAREGVEGAGHITPLHWSTACRLVIEGGFRPEWIAPRPPFVYETRGAGAGQRLILRHDSAAASSGERTVLGGLKTKRVDVVVALEGVGPCVAISLKGTLNAFRNLTNRMEEAIGDCTNLHITYPALVYGFLHVLRANLEGPVPDNGRHFLQPDKDGRVKPADVAVLNTGEVAGSIRTYHIALAGLTNRRGVRNDLTRYEAVALAVVSAGAGTLGEIVTSYPSPESPLLISDFFTRLYQQYDQRFVYGAPALARVTQRVAWDPESPVLQDSRIADSDPRISAGPLRAPLPEHEIPEEESDT